MKKTPSMTIGESIMTFRRGDVVLIPFPYSDEPTLVVYHAGALTERDLAGVDDRLRLALGL